VLARDRAGMLRDPHKWRRARDSLLDRLASEHVIAGRARDADR